MEATWQNSGQWSLNAQHTMAGYKLEPSQRKAPRPRMRAWASRVTFRIHPARPRRDATN